jgi:hypothetical protein
MTRCLASAYKVLRPGKWITIEFSNTSAIVWNNIQTSLVEAGFIVANVAALDNEGNVRLKAGDVVRIKLAGFKAKSTVEAWLFSTPQLMGTAKVGADGVVVGNFVVPKNVPQGSHRIAIVAQTTDGKPATLTVGVKVGEWKKEKTITVWLIILPIVLAVFGAMFLPAVVRRRRHEM